jgi:hypothetical protein
VYICGTSDFMLKNGIHNITFILAAIIIVVVVVIPATHGGGA